MDQKIYKDMLGNELRIKFFIGGINNDIFCINLYRKIDIPILKWFSKSTWVKVSSSVTCDNLSDVANWTDKEYTDLIMKAISQYNEETVSKEAIKLRIKTLNSY